MDWLICPCCGTEFENDDVRKSHQELRDGWVSRGVPWFSTTTQPPVNWDPYRQLVMEYVRPASSVDSTSEVLLPGEHYTNVRHTADAETLSYDAAA